MKCNSGGGGSPEHCRVERSLEESDCIGYGAHQSTRANKLGGDVIAREKHLRTAAYSKSHDEKSAKRFIRGMGREAGGKKTEISLGRS